MKYDIYGNTATLDHVLLPVKSGCDFIRDKDMKPIKRTRSSCQAIADRMARKANKDRSYSVDTWSGIVADCSTHYRINLAGQQER